MAFPTSPTDGQVYTTAFGSRYKYYSADNKWVKDGTLIGETGARGLTGPGATGLQGETGLQGDTGPEGLQGVTGLDYGATGALSIVLDGGGATLETGLRGDVQVPFNISLDSWRLLGDPSGTLMIQLWKDTYANYPPTSADSITGGYTGPQFTGTNKNEESTLSGWTTTLNSGDILRVNIADVSNVTNATLALNYHKN